MREKPELWGTGDSLRILPELSNAGSAPRARRLSPLLKGCGPSPALAEVNTGPKKPPHFSPGVTLALPSMS